MVRGFQGQDQTDIETAAPTVTKESIRLLVSMAAGQQWDVNSIDIKGAFLQSKPLERDVWVKPPLEAGRKKGKLWKLTKSVYGLGDASREWYLTFSKFLVSTGAQSSPLDKCLFTWHDATGSCTGMLALCGWGTKILLTRSSQVSQPISSWVQ